MCLTIERQAVQRLWKSDAAGTPVGRALQESSVQRRTVLADSTACSKATRLLGALSTFAAGFDRHVPATDLDALYSALKSVKEFTF